MMVKNALVGRLLQVKIVFLLVACCWCPRMVLAQDLDTCTADYHADWVACIESEGCQFCTTTPASSCIEWSIFTCGWQNCCPACSDKISTEYIDCADTAGCITPNCNIATGGIFDDIANNITSLVANITSCQPLLDGYITCLDNLQESGLADSCEVAFTSYEACVEGLDLPELDDLKEISWCNGFHQAWSRCATREGCSSACGGEEGGDMMPPPEDCAAYEGGVCELASCCPACQLLITDSYMGCAMRGGGCTNPECETGGGDGGGGDDNAATPSDAATTNLRASTTTAAAAVVLVACTSTLIDLL